LAFSRIAMIVRAHNIKAGVHDRYDPARDKPLYVHPDLKRAHGAINAQALH